METIGPNAILVLWRKLLDFRAPLIIDAEVVHLSAGGVTDFDALHSRTADEKAVALAFELLLSGEDIRRQPLIERKTALKWVLRKAREGIQYVEHAEGQDDKLFAAVCKLGLEGIVSKKLNAPYRSGPSRSCRPHRAGWHQD